jgi:methylase of polypeptide subunit release factors
MTSLDLPRRPELGQVWTPPNIAREMVDRCMTHFPQRFAVKALDPACGPATFSTAFHEAGGHNVTLDCFDIDPRMVKATATSNHRYGIQGAVVQDDYLAATKLSNTYDLVIMNPPYIRQELISQGNKQSYHAYISEALCEETDKRSNLFVLFLLKGIVDLVPGGILCAIVYDAITQSRYGKRALKTLERHAEIIERKSVKAPFEGVLVDAQVIIYRKRNAPLLELNRETLSEVSSGFARLSALLQSRRGTPLKTRALYLATPTDPHFQQSIPFFVKQGTLQSLIVKADARAYIGKLSTAVQMWMSTKSALIGRKNPGRFEIEGVAGPILFNYYIRKSPRHLWNASNVAVADNFYVSAPTDGFPAEVAWLLLNADKYLEPIVSASRNQGNGLQKLQLFEYKNVVVPDWRLLPGKEVAKLLRLSRTLIAREASYSAVRQAANKAIEGLLQ